MEIVKQRQWLFLTVVLVSISILCTRIKALTIAVETKGYSGQWTSLEYNSTQIKTLKNCTDPKTSPGKLCRIETESPMSPIFKAPYVQIPRDNFIESGNTNSDEIAVWSGYYHSAFGNYYTTWTKKVIKKANLCSDSENCQPLTLITWSNGSNVEMYVVWNNEQTARITQWGKDIINVINCCDAKDTTTRNAAITSTASAKTQSAKIASTTADSTTSSTKTTIEVSSTTGSNSTLSTNISPNAQENNDNEAISPLTIGVIIGLGVTVVIIIILTVLVFICKKRIKNIKRGHITEHATTSTSTQRQNEREEISDTAPPTSRATASTSQIMLNPSSTSSAEIDSGINLNPAITASFTRQESSGSIATQSHNEYEEPSHSTHYHYYSSIEPMSSTVYENDELSDSQGHSHQTAAVSSTSTKVNGDSSRGTKNSVAPEANKMYVNTAGIDPEMVTNNERPSEPTLRQEVRSINTPDDFISPLERSEPSMSSTYIPMVPTCLAKQPPVTSSGDVSASNSSRNQSKAKSIGNVQRPPQSDPETCDDVPVQHEYFNEVHCNITDK